ncbi:MAG: hypothetical protein LQ338_003944 [Usnochroma carphineum]|nr:MAG: hypothetical protein LQ338_003944 [Usnochroma carphineum]
MICVSNTSGGVKKRGTSPLRSTYLPLNRCRLLAFVLLKHSLTQSTVVMDGQNQNSTSADLGKSMEQELDEKFPNRPRNHSKTLPFHDLFLTLFNPLNENKKKPTGPTVARKKQGPHGPSNRNPHEVRRSIIEHFISRWRSQVGDDIFPAFRLILPDKDRERAMYGLKEKTIGKILIKVMKINKDSEDGYNLINWKQPGQGASSRMAGDFAGRCHEIIGKRPFRTEVGNMSIQEVNDLLDDLSAAQKEDIQQRIFERFYKNMNPDELMWLIRIILRQMKVGATEKTFFDIWHPDAESLFNISSNLRRVCWELYDPSVRLEGDDRGITLMQCFQPQLAQFQMHDFTRMIAKMRLTEEDRVFWVEEKLDGERMQLHMVSDDTVPGGKRFAFWSRKAKDYTYLYGSGLDDDQSALTRHLKNVFQENVRSIILDGEMITWDPEQDAMVPFGTLKTAALEQQKNPLSKGHRPLYKVFDILYLNGQPLTGYTLRDRRKALEASVRSENRRLEIHKYVEATSAKEVERMLQIVVAEASEGLVIKNPRSAYRLNDRNDDWIKVKPEYMTEFGEDLDCIVIGGYYGSGRRGGNLSSFMCGLRVDENQVRQGANPMKCYSFFKVGGGFTAQDYQELRHRTDGKWRPWDPKRPPTEYIELAGGQLQYERPDVWIRPDDSVVISVKAAQVTPTDSFRTGHTLRFPRFKKIRTDRDWTTALSLSGFQALKSNAELETDKKKMQVDDSRRKRQKISRKKPLTVAGSNTILKSPYGGPATSVFHGLSFYIMSESLKPEKKTKEELEQMVKANGGRIFQQRNASADTICVGDRRTVKLAAMAKTGEVDIIRPLWMFDCIKLAESERAKPPFLLPLEPRHVFWTFDGSRQMPEVNVDKYNDSFARDVDVEELRDIFDAMPAKSEESLDLGTVKAALEEHNRDHGILPGWLFAGLVLYFDMSPVHLSNGRQVDAGDKKTSSLDPEMKQICSIARFAGAQVADHLQMEGITHVVMGKDTSRLGSIRQNISG